MFLVLFVFHSLAPATAAQSGLTVWPAKVELPIGRGESSNSTISLENHCESLTRVRVYVMDFSIDKDDNYSFSEPGHESYSCSEWLDVEEEYLDLAPGERREVKVTVAVPLEVEPGGHYAALFFETIPLEGQPRSNVPISTRVASLFYVTVPGVTEADVYADAEIASLILPGWIDGGPVKVGTIVRNTGNVHVTLAAKAYFKDDVLNRSVGEIDLGQVVILPGNERLLEGYWDDTPLFGNVKVRVVIGYYDQQGELVNKSETGAFGIVPWKLMVRVGAPIGCLALLLIYLFKKRYHLVVRRRTSA